MQLPIAAPPENPYEKQRYDVLQRAQAYVHRMREGEFFSHETAAALWGAPLPSVGELPLHVSVIRGRAEPRAAGVRGHRIASEMVRTCFCGGMLVAAPASTWAMLGHLRLYDVVAMGDYFARVWRGDGYFRKDPGTPPLVSIDELAKEIRSGRRRGIHTLREALPRVRTDSWSPMETWTRLAIVDAGLPEPTLNCDQYDKNGAFLACLDLAYPESKIAIEYHGQFHSAQFARDVERVERLRANGWIVIQVTSELLLRNPSALARRVLKALLTRGWRF